MTKLVRKENEREQWREDAFDGAQEGLVDSEELAAPLGDLPPVEFAFAYGSGVFAQHQPPRVQLANDEVDFKTLKFFFYSWIWHFGLNLRHGLSGFK